MQLRWKVPSPRFRAAAYIFATVALCLSAPLEAQDDNIIVCATPVGSGPHIGYHSINTANQVVQFDLTTGVVLATITRGLNGPSGLACFGTNLYVANTGGNTITVYNSSFQHVNTFSNGIGGPLSVAVDAYGDVYVTNSPLFGAIVVLREDGSVAENLFQDTNGNSLSGAGPIAIYHRLIYAGPVRVPPGWAVEGFNVGEFLTDEPKPMVSFTQNVESATGIAFDADGNVYISDFQNGAANEFSPSGQLIMTFRDPNGGFCTGVAVDTDTGNVYVANGAPINSISVFNSQGMQINTFHF